MEEWKARPIAEDSPEGLWRKHLLSLTDLEAEKLSAPDQYQRIRYMREVEAANYVRELRSKTIAQRHKEVKPWKSKFKEEDF